MTMDKVFIGFGITIALFVVFLFSKVVESEQRREGLYQACIDDKQPAYACYGLIYGGGVRR